MNPSAGVAYFPEEEQEGIYSFIQTLDSVTVTFKVPAGTTKRDIDVQLTNTTIKAGVRGKAPNVEGKLYEVINGFESLWQIESSTSTVTIHLEKVKNEFWAALVKEGRVEPTDVDPKSEYELGKVFETSLMQNLEKSLQLYINAANKGLLEAQKRLAVIYLGLDIFGQNEPPVITPDADIAVKYLRMAIEQHKSKWSMLKLGDIYSVGLGSVAKNIEEAERWYNEAASQGEPFGLYKIGNLYVKEKRDFENAIRWWKKAADRNCAEAHVQLGMLLLKGEKIDGRDVDLRRARDHFRAAVKLNPALRPDVPTEETMERLISQQDRERARAAHAEQAKSAPQKSSSGAKKEHKTKKGKNLKSSSKTAKAAKQDTESEASEASDTEAGPVATGKGLVLGAAAVLGLFAAFALHRIMASASQRVN